MKPMANTDDAIEMPALGRPFHLGMLYDCRSEILIPGITLWDSDTLQNHVDIKSQRKTEFHIITSDSVNEKASALNLSASLKASFQVGLVEVGGSATYLKDTKKSMNHARVALQYSTTTEFKQLTMRQLGRQNVSYRDVFEQGTATHVVTAVLYGAQAFFVFDYEASRSESKQDMEAHLEGLISKLLRVPADGELSLKMDGMEKEISEKLSCTFHGDFALEKNPATYQDAMKIYIDLPKMLGKKGEKAVPIRVWLYPLVKMDSKAARMVREISLQLVFDTQNTLEKLTEIDIRCNDLAKNPVVTTFPKVKEKILQLKDLCKQHRQTFQKELAQILPAIRGGGKEERSLVDILRCLNQSPFNTQTLGEFLDKKEREMSFVKSYLSELKELEVIASQSKLDEILLDHRNTFVVAFMFTSLQDEEPYLSDLQQWLQKPFYGRNFRAYLSHSFLRKQKSKPWFEDQERIQNIRKAAKSVLDFARVNKGNGHTRFIMSSAHDANHPGASVFFYQETDLVSTNFELPSRPLPPVVSGIEHNRAQLRFNPAAYGRAAISGFQVQYRVAGEEKWRDVDAAGPVETFTVSELLPNTTYQFRYASMTPLGLSESSEETEARTLPTSPPGKPEIVTLGSSVISVSWEGPQLVGEGAVIQEYKVECREELRDACEGKPRTGKCNNHPFVDLLVKIYLATFLLLMNGLVWAAELWRKWQSLFWDPSHQENKEEWSEQRTGSKTEFCQVENLRPQRSYRVRVSAVCADGALSAPSEEADVSTSLEEEAKTRLVHKYLQQSPLIGSGKPWVFALPLKKATGGSSTSCLTYQLGEENLCVPNKVIVMMGATGSGKTTLINRMVNHILGVERGDIFQFQLAREMTNRLESGRQTSEVTTYRLNNQEGFQVPFSLTLIDTPGFGDTKGREEEKWIKKQIHKIVSISKGIGHIDAICVVVPASLSCLTPAQKDVFHSLVSIFEQDIQDNIQVLVSFAEGETLPVLEAIKEAGVPCAKDASGTPVHFTFNNPPSSARTSVDNDGTTNCDKILWRRGTESLSTFFETLHDLEMKRLGDQKELETAVDGLQPHIEAGLGKLEKTGRENGQALDQHVEGMEATKGFDHKGEAPSVRKEGLLEEAGKTKIAQRYLQKSIVVDLGHPYVYALPLEVTSDATTSCLTYHLGEENLWVPNKVVMMMGATGSGKTTLINRMINYILGVQWEDKFRFKLIHEINHINQVESQTSDVTAYVLNHQKGFQVSCSLTIIDTPGFGDMRGVEHDKLITQKIRDFFSTPGGTDHVDAICIVVPASLARLTHAQKYMFDSVLSIFGKDIKDNTQILVTFADGQPPTVLEAIKEANVPCAKDASGTPVHFKFNNSAFFANNPVHSEGSFNFDEMFWKMGYMSMKTFFDSLNKLETRSLTLTKELLRERKELETLIAGVQTQIKIVLVKVGELEKAQQVLDQHKEDIKANQDFEYEVEVVESVKEDTENYATNCRKCTFTCHYPCRKRWGFLNRFCTAFSCISGWCHVCPGRCSVGDHSQEKYRFVNKIIKKTKTFEALKENYVGILRKVTPETLVEQLRAEEKKEREILTDLITKAAQTLRRLQEIALKPTLLSTPEYLNLLIQQEEQEGELGDQERAQRLKKMRREAELVQRLARNSGVNFPLYSSRP